MTDQEAREARAALVEAIGWGERYGAHAVALTVSVASLRALVERYDRKSPEPHFEYKYGTRERRKVYPAGEWEAY